MKMDENPCPVGVRGFKSHPPQIFAIGLIPLNFELSIQLENSGEKEAGDLEEVLRKLKIPAHTSTTMKETCHTFTSENAEQSKR